jgi:hypothetical protein
VRCVTNRSRARCRACRSSCAARLIGTKRICGRCTASPIASASAWSCLLVLTNGRTYCAGIRRTSWPSSVSRHARWCAPHDASRPIRAGGRLASQATSLGRVSRRLATTLPRPSMATTSHAVLPRSIPMVLICIGSSPASLVCPPGPYQAPQGRTIPLPKGRERQLVGDHVLPMNSKRVLEEHGTMMPNEPEPPAPRSSGAPAVERVRNHARSLTNPECRFISPI